MSQLRTSSIQHPSSANPNIVLAADGSVEIGNMNGYRFAGTRYFTSDGTFLKADPLGTGDIGLRAIRVRMVGGGGGGGGSQDNSYSSGGGGAGGDYAESFITDIASLASSVDVVRGAGGAGGAGAATSTSGSAGGQSSFASTLVVAGGGRGGGRGVSNAAQGGLESNVAAVGDLTLQGNPGFAGGADRLGSNPFFIGGNGGSSHLGGGALGIADVVPGRAGGAHGGGGSGGSQRNDPNGQDGGAGANGIVIIDCFV